jgi:DNA-binding transcriptional regulator YdaS (Cro superfamily)
VSALARCVGVKPPTVHQWLTGLRPVPSLKAPLIEHETGVSRWDLRPADWHRIWPELIGADGAPPIPEEIRDVA